MEVEFEVKFYPINKEQVRKKLKLLEAKLIHPERKMRRAIADIRVNPQLKCDYIRVRDEGNAVRFSAKTHAEETGKITDQKEIDVEVSNYDKTINILKNAGLIFNSYQETLRETWELDSAKIEIESWPGIKPRLEIEADSEESVKDMAEKLGFDWSKKIITAMPEIYSRVFNISLDEALELMSDLTFENNPFKRLTVKWDGE